MFCDTLNTYSFLFFGNEIAAFMFTLIHRKKYIIMRDINHIEYDIRKRLQSDDAIVENEHVLYCSEDMCIASKIQIIDEIKSGIILLMKIGCLCRRVHKDLCDFMVSRETNDTYLQDVDPSILSRRCSIYFAFLSSSPEARLGFLVRELARIRRMNGALLTELAKCPVDYNFIGEIKKVKLLNQTVTNILKNEIRNTYGNGSVLEHRMANVIKDYKKNGKVSEFLGKNFGVKWAIMQRFFDIRLNNDVVNNHIFKHLARLSLQDHIENVEMPLIDESS
jgi:hypothetical protein